MLLAVLGLLIFKETRQARAELQGWGNTTRFDRQAATMYFIVFAIIWPVPFYFILREYGVPTMWNWIITTVTALFTFGSIIFYPLIGVWVGWESAKVADRKNLERMYNREEEHRARVAARRKAVR